MSLTPNQVDLYEDMPAANSSAIGAVTIPLRPVPLGTRVVFTVSIPGAAPLSQWTVNRGNPALGPMQDLMSWVGPSPVGPFTIDGPGQITITGTGLLASTPYQVVALGKSGPAALIDPEVPLGPPGSTILAGGPPIVLDSFQYNGVVQTEITPLISPGIRSVTVVLKASTGSTPPVSLVVGAAQSNIVYFDGTIPLDQNSFLTGLIPVTFAIDPDETQLRMQLSGGGTSCPVTVLGESINTAVALRPPTNMAPNAQYFSQSGPPTQLDLALWTARADCPRFVADGIFTANGTLIAAPGAGLRLKLYDASAGTGSTAVGNAALQAGASLLWRTNILQQTKAEFDFGGFELPAATALTVLWTAGTAVYNVAYDIVPA